MVHPHDISTIWAGTEIGLVESTDNGASWALRVDFVNTSIWEMKAVDDQVVLATHGRGIWSVTIDGLVWPTELVTSTTDIIQPSKLSVSNYPNPVSGSTTIRYDLPEASRVRIDVLNSKGQVLTSQNIGMRPAGSGSLVWNRNPMTHYSGVYLIRLQAGQAVSTSKMIVE